MQGRQARDDGFTLLEAVVAMIVFGIVATSTAAVLVRAVGGASDNRARAAAANIAAQAMDTMRSGAKGGVGYTKLTSQALPDVTVQGRTYHVYQTVTPVIADSAGREVSACTTNGVSKQKFKQVGIAVTWENSGLVQPVRSDTIVQNPGVAADSTKGALGVVVSDQKGAGVARMTVTLDNGRKAVTDDSGCAYFDTLAPAAYQATVDATGYVDASGNAKAADSTSIRAGGTSRMDLLYAKAAKVTMLFGPIGADGKTDTTYNVPLGAPTSPYSAVAGSNPKVTGTTDSTTVTRTFFPWDSGYYAYLGKNCSPQFPTQPVIFTTLPGATSTTAVPGAGLTLRNSGSRTVAVQLSNKNYCAPTDATTVTVTLPPGTAKLAIPFGTWEVTASTTTTVTMTQSAPTTTVTVS